MVQNYSRTDTTTAWENFHFKQLSIVNFSKTSMNVNSYYQVSKIAQFFNSDISI